MKPVRYLSVAVLACIATFLFLRYVVSPSDFYGRELYSAEEVSAITASISFDASPAPSQTAPAKPDVMESPLASVSNAVSDPETVYIAGEGKQTYHKTPTCSGMKNAIAIPFSQTEGMKACKKCFPSDEA